METTNAMGGGKGGWATQGFGGLQKEEERLATLYGPNRVWIKPGTTQQLVFIDDDPLCFHEHNPKINGEWKNWLTCLQNISEDGVPCCEILGAKTRYYVAYFTVVDCSKWTDKKGNVHQYEVKLLAAKVATQNKLKRKKENKGTLVGHVYKVTRETDRSPGCGDDFEFEREADLAKLFEVANYKGKKLSELFAKASEDPVVQHMLKQTFDLKYDDQNKLLPKIPRFNYTSLFEPKSAKAVRSMLSGVKIEGWDDDKGTGGGAAGGAGADEEVPF